MILHQTAPTEGELVKFFSENKKFHNRPIQPADEGTKFFFKILPLERNLVFFYRGAI